MLKKFDSILARIMEVIMTVSLLLTVTVTFIQVLFRYVLGMPLPWAQEFLMLCFVYSIFSGAAVLVYKNEHLTVDLFDNLGRGMDKVLKVLESVVAIFVLGVFVYFGMDLVNQNFATGQTLGLLPVQRAYLYMAIPVSAAVMIYFYIRRFFSIWSG
ncbi:TRAP transporter small permease [Salinicoccus roseus]|uniref:TRAP transporter small permease n=1 Tax=Salinicoccus roseus TaxID=45670 RepID=UPI001CA6D607|nr:TRAP transporter small permease [Salinicoccus roseus]MBY8909807.1 TRAP transporter small permease [Salinicoccus roseus]